MVWFRNLFKWIDPEKLPTPEKIWLERLLDAIAAGTNKLVVLQPDDQGVVHALAFDEAGYIQPPEGYGSLTPLNRVTMMGECLSWNAGRVINPLPSEYAAALFQAIDARCGPRHAASVTNQGENYREHRIDEADGSRGIWLYGHFYDNHGRRHLALRIRRLEQVVEKWLDAFLNTACEQRPRNVYIRDVNQEPRSMIQGILSCCGSPDCNHTHGFEPMTLLPQAAWPILYRTLNQRTESQSKVRLKVEFDIRFEGGVVKAHLWSWPGKNMISGNFHYPTKPTDVPPPDRADSSTCEGC